MLKILLDHLKHLERYTHYSEDAPALREAIEILDGTFSRGQENDLISRQDAIEAVRTMQSYKLSEDDDMLLIDKAEVQTELMLLPSAQPDEKRTDKRTETHACDCISKQAAIDQLHQSYNLLDAEARIEDLPSAQPEPHYDEWCTGCKEYDHERHSCPRWNRVIRQAVEDLQSAQPKRKNCETCRYDSLNWDEEPCDSCTGDHWKPHWISCQTMVPETQDTCLVMNCGVVDIGYYDGNFWYFRDGNEDEKHQRMTCGKDIQAWMPLPEPWR